MCVKVDVFLPILRFSFFCFFLLCTGDHRDLHSFPTRRSSDLAELGDQKRFMTPREAIEAGADYIGIGRPITARSEEHTSELQSLAYLVCRLLLEKKKKSIAFRPASAPAPRLPYTR